MSRLYLEDRVDMVTGHFGIYRMNGSKREFWNENQNKWVSYGCSVYVGAEVAASKIEELTSPKYEQ